MTLFGGGITDLVLEDTASLSMLMLFVVGGFFGGGGGGGGGTDA